MFDLEDPKDLKDPKDIKDPKNTNGCVVWDSVFGAIGHCLFSSPRKKI